jgi:hypothetical protein
LAFQLSSSYSLNLPYVEWVQIPLSRTQLSLPYFFVWVKIPLST